MVKPGAGRPVKSADRTLDVLELLAAASERMTLAELSRAMAVPKSSLHALLATMRRRGWVEADGSGSRFGLGVHALLVGASYVDTDPVVALTADTLDWLAAAVGETVHLGRLDGPDIVYLAKRESTHPLRLFSAIGRRLPAHATALGKAVLADRDDAEVRACVGQRPIHLTHDTLVGWSALKADLDATRARGYAVDNEENTVGIRCFGVAIGPRRPRADAISASVPVARLDAERTEEIVARVLESRERADATLAATRCA